MKRKIAGVYDRWLHTLGGGEQVAFAYAQALLDMGYDVHIITFQKIDVKKAEQKMGISLNKIQLVYLKESDNENLQGISGKYDLFINTSHLDYFPNSSKNGILSVFFPATIRLSLYEYIKRVFFIPTLRNFFIYPSRYENFLRDEYRHGKIYKWLSDKSSIIFKDDIKKVAITLYFENFSFSVIDQIVFLLDEETIQPSSRLIDIKNNHITYSFNLKNTKGKAFSILLPDNQHAKKVALLNFTIAGLRFYLYNLFKSIFPLWEMRLHGGPGATRLSDLTSYQKIVTISEFCKKWINTYWGLDSEILYPPVNTENFAPAKKKKNVILHVGRFFVTGHSKKQLDLAKAFIRMQHKNNVGDWELHFVGSIAEGNTHKQYFDSIVNEAKGHPIFFHNNVSFEELRKLLSEAKIYWHATGLDEDEDRNPLAMEHFGITTVEAMASGCVPVVINKGGQREIVTPESGFKWDTRDELIAYTSELINNPAKLVAYSQEAIKRSKFFSKVKFKQRFKEIINS